MRPSLSAKCGRYNKITNWYVALCQNQINHIFIEWMALNHIWRISNIYHQHICASLGTDNGEAGNGISKTYPSYAYLPNIVV